MMTKLLTFFMAGMLCLVSFDVVAQTKNTSSENQVWLAYNNQTRLSNKWGVWGDFHLRTREDFFTRLSTGIARVGLMYYINDATKLTAGYAFVNHFPADNHKNISQPEHRPWQQIQWHTNYPKLKLAQWVRLEERYRRKILNDDQLADGYSFNFRVRYNVMLRFPLSKKLFQPGALSFIVGDEVHVNFGKQVVYNYFDQNRFYAGIAWHITKTDDLQFSYMNFFQQLAAGNSYRNYHNARIFYFHNLDLRKQKTK